jgi:peptidyl-prolyl cis-trans isomerase SurA
MLISRFVLLLMVLAASLSLQAQELQLKISDVLLASPVNPTNANGQRRPADFIVAVVNSEPITNNELQLDIERARQQLAQQRRPVPTRAELAREVLERIIIDRVQLQLARDTGLRADGAAIDAAEQTIARQNQLELPELRRRVAADGVSPAQFRTQLRDQIVLSRLRERELEPRARVTELDIDEYLRQAQESADPSSRQINLAQILIVVPDDANAEQMAVRQARAEAVLARVRAGEDFATLARELSDAAEKANGGQLGLRPLGRYPPLFVEASQKLAVGEVSGLLRSGAGFHILKLLERPTAGLLLPAATTQSRARHILLRPGPRLTEAAALDRLDALREQVLSGRADFATLAREVSQDGSAAQGGDLGWAGPGMFVPEFEQVMNQLALGQLSEPLVSRFGVHLIQLLERRQVETSQREQREAVRNLLRERKLDEAFPVWAQDLRGRAYVELREAPQ